MFSRFITFVLTFVALMALTYAFLAMVDALPNAPQISDPKSQITNSPDNPSENSGQAELPTRIVAKDIKLDVTVANPTATDIDVLDAALLKGSVRYPTSAMLGENGTVLVFGHSSYLPIVHNQNYKAFDGIQNLRTGAIISVFAGTHEYRYAVTGVRLANATEDVVELPSDGQYLTLVTCDSFATKSDRFVVTAKLVK